MRYARRCRWTLIPGVLLALAATIPPGWGQAEEPAGVPLARDGRALLPVHRVRAPLAEPQPRKKPKGRPIWMTADSGVDEALADLTRCLQAMTGAAFTTQEGADVPRTGGKRTPAIYVGTPAALGLTVAKPELSSESFILKTEDGSVLIASPTELGQSHAIYGFLESLGCRWYFPGELWEILPTRPNLSVRLDERQRPDFNGQRLLVFVYANKSPRTRQDIADWSRRNRQVQNIAASGHVWPGIDPKADFARHPEWFALTPDPDGRLKRQPTKPCYANPDVIERGTQVALKHFADNPRSMAVSVTPPDDAGYCQCDACLRLAAVTSVSTNQGVLFGRTAAGDEVCVTSETVYRYVNAVARAVAGAYPGRYVVTAAYSSYSHPPSFDLEPNVYMFATMGFRRSPLAPEDLLTEQSRRVSHLGIYEYYDVINWDWDLPGHARAAQLDYIADSIRYYQGKGVVSLKAEASNNWGPNGLGYYVIARLLWDTRQNVGQIEDEFYREAFGPAAGPVRRFYDRWASGIAVNPGTLALGYRDLQEAADLTADREPFRTRVDRLRMYAHFLKIQLIKGKPGAKEVAQWKSTWGEDGARQRLEEFGEYVSRLMDTHMVQSYGFGEFIEMAGRELGVDGSRWRQPGAIPTADEVEAWFAADLKELLPGIAKELDIRRYSRDLVRVDPSLPALLPHTPAAIHAGPFDEGSMFLMVTQGEEIEIGFQAVPPTEVDGGAANAEAEPSECSYGFLSPEAFRAEQFMAARKSARQPLPVTLRILAAKTGFCQVNWSRAHVTHVNRPCVLAGGGFSVRNATLYFLVPQGTRRFLLRSTAPGFNSFDIRDGKGKSVLQICKTKESDFSVDVPAGSDGGIWSVQGPDVTLRGGRLSLAGVPNYFSLLPSLLLVPRETAGVGATAAQP